MKGRKGRDGGKRDKGNWLLVGDNELCSQVSASFPALHSLN